MIIRKAIGEDVEALKALWREFIDFHKSTDRFFPGHPTDTNASENSHWREFETRTGLFWWLLLINRSSDIA